MPNNNVLPVINETHINGHVSIETIPHGPLLGADFGIQISEDGRVWICINGVAFLRFKPKVRAL